MCFSFSRDIEPCRLCLLLNSLGLLLPFNALQLTSNRLQGRWGHPAHGQECVGAPLLHGRPRSEDWSRAPASLWGSGIFHSSCASLDLSSHISITCCSQSGYGCVTSRIMGRLSIISPVDPLWWITHPAEGNGHAPWRSAVHLTADKPQKRSTQEHSWVDAICGHLGLVNRASGPSGSRLGPNLSYVSHSEVVVMRR